MIVASSSPVKFSKINCFSGVKFVTKFEVALQKQSLSFEFIVNHSKSDFFAP